MRTIQKEKDQVLSSKSIENFSSLYFRKYMMLRLRQNFLFLITAQEGIFTRNTFQTRPYLSTVRWHGTIL